MTRLPSRRRCPSVKTCARTGHGTRRYQCNRLYLAVSSRTAPCWTASGGGRRSPAPSGVQPRFEQEVRGPALVPRAERSRAAELDRPPVERDRRLDPETRDGGPAPAEAGLEEALLGIAFLTFLT